MSSSDVRSRARRGNPFVKVLRFTFGHWRRQRWLAVGVSGLMLGSTLAEMVVPLLAGRLVDIVAGVRGHMKLESPGSAGNNRD